VIKDIVNKTNDMKWDS